MFLNHIYISFDQKSQSQKFMLRKWFQLAKDLSIWMFITAWFFPPVFKKMRYN